MKILIDAQYFTTPPALRRGPFQFSTVLIKELLKRGQNDYELFFFDKNRERNNLKYVKELMNEIEVPIHECNNVSYKELQYAVSNSQVYSSKDITTTDFDIIFFQTPVFVKIPNRSVQIAMFHDCGFKNFHGRTHISDIEKLRFMNAESVFSKVIENDTIAFTVSEYTKQQFLKNTVLNEKNLFVISDLYDSYVCYEEVNLDFVNKYTENSPYILFIGKLDTKKNLNRIIKAFEIVNAKYNELKLVLIGNYGKLNDESKYYSEMIESSSSQGNIIVLHDIDDVQKRWFLSSAELLFFPSLYEGFGIPIIEAQACGCPVLTSTTTACPTTAGEGGAVLVDPYDLEDIVSGVECILNDAELKSSLIQNGYKNIKLYTPDKCAELTELAFEAIYNRLR